MTPLHPLPAASRGLLRRRWPRLETHGRIRARIVVLDLSMAVRDVSLGGFAVEAPVRFAHGEAHEFQLQLDGRDPVVVRARAVYCHALRERTGLFITGWEALGDPATTSAMARVVHDLLAAQPSAVPAAPVDIPATGRWTQGAGARP